MPLADEDLKSLTPAQQQAEADRLFELAGRVARQQADRYAGLPENGVPAAMAAGDIEYLATRLALAEGQLQAERLDLVWMAPGQAPNPREVMRRLQAICRHRSGLFDAVVTAAVTHPGVPPERLAQALLACRPDLAPYPLEDVTSLVKASLNGGRDGFEAVLRTRKSSDRKVAGGFSWVKPD
ncbi:hypothetical protein [Ideonella livida]|uniref:Uncharacterized protein n=1 Tax=Ideonella livida TaxID=2707176 RepID=A0A7C9PE66_9BURK|nr:hypothetical protein [Ideonella livida]NDY89577.1 hypothetical protein [Ideonella livida]